jgi:hypothetical protein
LNYRRKSVEVVATQLTHPQLHPSVRVVHVELGDKDGENSNMLYYIQTDFGEVEIKIGDWIVEIDSKIKVLKDEYFKEHYEEIVENIKRPKLILVTDCE